MDIITHFMEDQMKNTRDTVLGNIVLYSVSENRMRVDISDQMKCLPLETRLSLLTVHKERLEDDLENYHNPKHMTSCAARLKGKIGEPPEEFFKTHLEITNNFISRLKGCLLNG